MGGSLTEAYTYDAVGNRLTSAGPVSFNYNASNELTSTSAATGRTVIEKIYPDGAGSQFGYAELNWRF